MQDGLPSGAMDITLPVQRHALMTRATCVSNVPAAGSWPTVRFFAL